MHIRVVTPIVTHEFRTPQEIKELTHPGLMITHTSVDLGPASIESAFEETMAGPGAVLKMIQAEQDGVDAVVIDCVGDIGMEAGREAVKIPVVGAGQAGMLVAASLGHRFSILTTLERTLHLNERQAQVYGIADKLASLRAVDFPVLQLREDINELVKRLLVQAVAAIEEDGAHVLLFGCTGMKHVADAVAVGLQEQGYDVPVVDPLTTAVRFAEMLVHLKLKPSKITYSNPPSKTIIGYTFPEGFTNQ
jgi:allantoin racemase